MKRFLAYFLACLLCPVLYAQSWDEALDQYEQICGECIRLRRQSSRGETVAATSILPLLNQLASLRKTLQAADGSMSPAQKSRFEAIRRRYDEIFDPGKSVPAVPRKCPDPLLNPKILLTAPEKKLSVPEHALAPVSVSTTHRKGTVMACADIPCWAPGLFFSLSKGKWGGFLKGSVTLRLEKASYSCYADGTTDAGYIWTSGNEVQKRFSIAAGGLYAPWPFLRFYAGAGYGCRQLLWEDSSGAWAKVKDRSGAGVVVDAGVIFCWKHLAVMTGISTVGLQGPAAELGVGYAF